MNDDKRVYSNSNEGGSGFGGRQARSPSDVLKPSDVPKPPTRSKGARRNVVVVMNFLMSCLVMGAVLLSILAYLGKYWFEKPGPLQTATTLVIEQGSSVTQITDKLVSNNVIDNDLVFRAWVRAYRAQSSLRAGEYLFKPNMSMLEVMETIRSGKGILHKVSVPEGLTVNQIFERLSKHEILEGEMPEEMPAEGSLMPDTYPFQRGTTRQEMIDRMKRAQADFLQEVWSRRIDGLPISTPEEMVILASIVEKETGKADERPRVASVFINRLRKGMRLQSDPTIIYGIFGGAGKPKDRPIYKSDIETPTPYNTYTIPALPPGPIANPGRAALEAVANPSRTDDLFFVANGTGGHAFAKTLEEHNQNVVVWRQIEADRKKEAEENSDNQ
jgi:UPF0755 protein